MIVALASSVTGMLTAGAFGQSTSNPSTSELDLERAFATALSEIDAERKTNHASEFSCTHFFAGFYRFKQIEPYIAFLQKIGFPARTVDLNRDHFVYLELTSEQLWTKGYKSFLRGDRLVIVFTTGSAASSEIISFSATLFGPTMP
jgi:hypothetical protein